MNIIETLAEKERQDSTIPHPHGPVRKFLQTVRGSLLQVHPVPLILGVATSAWYLAPIMAALGDRPPAPVTAPSNRPSIVSPPPTNLDPVNKIEGEVPPTEPTPPPSPDNSPPTASTLPPRDASNLSAAGAGSDASPAGKSKNASANTSTRRAPARFQETQSRQLPVRPSLPSRPPSASTAPFPFFGQNQNGPYGVAPPRVMQRLPFGPTAYRSYAYRGPIMRGRYMGGFRGGGGRRR